MSHLSVVMTTTEETGITDGDGSGSSRGIEFYFLVAVIVIGVIGTTANGFVLYALVASKQHKKHVLIVHQNVLDLISCFFLIINYSLKLYCNISLTGSTDYWLRILSILSENVVYTVMYASVINLAIISVERYLRIVHPVWSKNKLRNWMIYSAMAFAWIAPIVCTLSMVFSATIVVDNECNVMMIFASESAPMVQFFCYLLAYYVMILLICIFCYWRILVAVRRQARVMAGHSAAGSSAAAQAQSNQIQTSVIKTMILVCAFYAILSFPMNMVMLLFTFAPDLQLDTAFFVAMFLSFLYVCTNPFIYAVKFRPVKQVLIGMITCQKPTEQASQMPGKHT